MTDVSSTPESDATAGTGIDTTVSHSARIWDYWLKGKDNYQVDREVGDRIEEMLPDIVRQAREDRLFLGRVVRYLAGEAGIRQFLDIHPAPTARPMNSPGSSTAWTWWSPAWSRSRAGGPTTCLPASPGKSTSSAPLAASHE